VFDQNRYFDVFVEYAKAAAEDFLIQIIIFNRRPVRRCQLVVALNRRMARPGRAAPRNDHWHHMFNADIVSMPDKWELSWRWKGMRHGTWPFTSGAIRTSRAGRTHCNLITATQPGRKQ
jgi:hypothetical protein